MGMMNKMMDAMIINMTPVERENMMCKMMPMMMKETDLNKIIPLTLKEISNMITLGGIIDLIIKIYNDQILTEELKNIFENLKESLPVITEKAGPFISKIMMHIMPVMMKHMSKIMPVMLPLMKKCMPEMMNGIIPEILKENPDVKECMEEMMQIVMPNFARSILSEVDEEKRIDFIYNLIFLMTLSGSKDMSLEKKKDFGNKIVEKVKEGLRKEKNEKMEDKKWD